MTALSRNPQDVGGDIELRIECRPDVLLVVDAMVKANKGTSRRDYVEEALIQWADQKVHEATLIKRMIRGNGIDSE